MAKDPIKLSWDDLNSGEVDEKLRRQQKLQEVRRQYESAPAPELLHRHKRTGIWYNAMVYMSVLGMLGGLLGWAVGQAARFRPDLRARADELFAERERITTAEQRGRITPAEAAGARAIVDRIGQDNPFFTVRTDASLTPAAREEGLARVAAQERWRNFVANIFFFGACGMAIALCLAASEPLVQRNYPSAIVNGSMGACLGLIGGVAVALFIDQLHRFIVGDGDNPEASRQVLARCCTWGVLGLFLGLAPGMAMRNRRRLIVGLFGGLVGGLAGGALYDFAANVAHSAQVGRLVAISAIGLVAGLATGMIEQVVKTGWLKVTEGLITGKQFVLYRNPTYLGSSPHCQIYLFKDATIGQRHAAVHVVPGGFELENLPLGGPTLLNGKPIRRVRMRAGDEIQISKTKFVFQEKAKKK